MINKTTFFNHIRASILFKGKISQLQVNGINAILDEFFNYNLSDLRWLAYMLATAYHETGKTMQPIEEWGKGKDKPYGLPSPETGKKYYGRGFVQLTWITNYAKIGKILGIDLIHNPELALDTKIAAKIMIEGMTTAKSFSGDFTNKHLGMYFNEKKDDPINARRIINGLDKAALIADYHKMFLQALTA